MIVLCEIIERREFILEKGCHPRDSVLIVTEGSFSCEMEGRRYIAGKNDVFVFRKDTQFRRKILSPLRAIYVIFDSLPEFDSGLLTTAYFSRTTENIALLLSLLSSGSAEKAAHYIDDILLTHSQTKAGREKNPIAEKCAAYFEANYSAPISLDTLAEHLFITKQGLIKSFKASYLQTPMAYLHTLRLKKSKALLQSTAKSASEIAELCGFRNVYYFSNCFKKQFGMSPLQYRKSLQL